MCRLSPVCVCRLSVWVFEWIYSFGRDLNQFSNGISLANPSSKMTATLLCGLWLPACACVCLCVDSDYSWTREHGLLPAVESQRLLQEISKWNVRQGVMERILNPNLKSSNGQKCKNKTQFACLWSEASGINYAQRAVAATHVVPTKGNSSSNLSNSEFYAYQCDSPTGMEVESSKANNVQVQAALT